MGCYPINERGRGQVDRVIRKDAYIMTTRVTGDGGGEKTFLPEEIMDILERSEDSIGGEGGVERRDTFYDDEDLSEDEIAESLRCLHTRESVSKRCDECFRRYDLIDRHGGKYTRLSERLSTISKIHNMYSRDEHDSEQLYREVILDLVKHPLNQEHLENFDQEFSGNNPLCGDELMIRVKYDGKGRIIDIGYTGQGCAISRAAASLLSEAVKGKTLEEVALLTEEDLSTIVGFSVMYMRKKCFTLALFTLQGRR